MVVEVWCDAATGRAVTTVEKVGSSDRVLTLETTLGGDWQDPGLVYDAEIGAEVDVRLTLPRSGGRFRRATVVAAVYVLDASSSGVEIGPLWHRLLEGPLGDQVRTALENAGK